MLVLTTERHAPQAVEFALSQAEQEKRPLQVLYVFDSALPESLGRRLSDEAFVSDQLTDNLTDAVKAEQEKEGAAFLEEVRRRALERKVECEIRILPGPLLETVPRAVRGGRMRRIILTRPRRRPWQRWLRASEIDELAAQLPCQVTILEE